MVCNSQSGGKYNKDTFDVLSEVFLSPTDDADISPRCSLSLIKIFKMVEIQ